MTAPGIDFQCGVQDSLCFFGSSCVILNTTLGFSQQKCINCPIGFEHDNSLGHFPNCAMPSDFMLGFFIVNTIGSVLAFVVVANELRNLRSDARRIGLMFLLALTTFWLSSLGWYVQRGLFEFCLVFYTLGALMSVGAGLSVVSFVIKPVYAVTNEPVTSVKLAVFGIIGGLSLLELGLNLSKFAFIRDENPRTYNLIASLSLACISLQFLIVPVLVWFELWRLIRLIQQSTEAVQDKVVIKGDTWKLWCNDCINFKESPALCFLSMHHGLAG